MVEKSALCAVESIEYLDRPINPCGGSHQPQGSGCAFPLAERIFISKEGFNT